MLPILSVDCYSEHIKFKMPSMNKRARLETYILQVSIWHPGKSFHSDVLTVIHIILG